MKKYYIGLAVICLVTLGFVGYVGFQGLSGKQDAQTEKKANEIAPKLNEYVASKNKIPESLDEAGIKDVPSSIKYTKQSDKEYKFCVTYKMASSYNYGDPVTALGGVVLGGGLNSGYYAEDSYDYNSKYPPASLYLYGSHKKGETCQTIKPYFPTNYSYDDPFYDEFSAPSTSTSTSGDDKEREADIKTIHSQVEAYYAQNGYYPTLANLNDSAFRAANLKGLDVGALKDPAGKASKLVAHSAAGSYAYVVLPASCDNSGGNECTMYTLTATYTNGKTYAKYSLN